MAISVSIVLILILGAAFLLSRRRAGHTSATTSSHGHSSKNETANEFHAVSLSSLASACAAAKALQGERFLSNSAPKLPLPECGAATCKCRFIHHSDRRSGEDRRDIYGSALGGGRTGQFKQEQRNQGERRTNPPG